jgi:hypothetical protein
MTKKTDSSGTTSEPIEAASIAPPAPAPALPYPMATPHEVPVDRSAGLPEVVTLYALSGFAAITLDGVTYKAAKDGTVNIPREHVETAKSHFLTDIAPGR